MEALQKESVSSETSGRGENVKDEKQQRDSKNLFWFEHGGRDKT